MSQNNNLPPYEVTIDNLPALLKNGKVEIILQAQSDTSPFDEVLLEDSIEMVNLFAEGVNAGFAEANSNNFTSMHELSKALDEENKQWVFLYEVHNLPSKLWLQLCAMLTQTYYAFSPLKKLEINAKEKQQDTITIEKLFQTERTITKPTDLPFSLDLIEENIWGGYPLEIEIEFNTSLTDVEFENIAVALNVWGNMLIFGAYFLDLHEDEEVIGNLGETKKISNRKLKYIVDDYNYPVYSLYPVIYYAKKLHAITTVSKIKIDSVTGQ